MARKKLTVGRYQDIERRLAEGRGGRELVNALGRSRRASAPKSTTRAIRWFDSPGAGATRRNRARGCGESFDGHVFWRPCVQSTWKAQH